jgi:hypothetical protein
MATSTIRVALTGWFSFADGEITAGDLLALDSVRHALDNAGVAYETFWSPGFRPEGPGLGSLAVPAPHSHLVFVCGPLHGEPVERLHRIFANSVRIAVGVSVIDPCGPAVTGFHRILARDRPGGPATVDLSIAASPSPSLPVAGVILTDGQGEYGQRRRHEQVTQAVTRHLRGKEAALVPLDTRTSTTEWELPSNAAAFEAVLGRMDLVVTSRLHGLVLALRRGVPALAVDPVAGGAKLTAQARALDWPAVLGADEIHQEAFDRWWSWCLADGRDLARTRQLDPPRHGPTVMTAALLEALSPAALSDGQDAEGPP